MRKNLITLSCPQSKYFILEEPREKLVYSQYGHYFCFQCYSRTYISVHIFKILNKIQRFLIFTYKQAIRSKFCMNKLCFEDTGSFEWSLTLHFLEVSYKIRSHLRKTQWISQSENLNQSISPKTKDQKNDGNIDFWGKKISDKSTNQNMRSLTLPKKVFNVTLRSYFITS